MANCSITDVTARLMSIFPPGVRTNAYEQGRIQEAIDATAQPVAEDADYATLMAAKVANAEAAAAKILDPPKPKAKAKAKSR